MLIGQAFIKVFTGSLHRQFVHKLNACRYCAFGHDHRHGVNGVLWCLIEHQQIGFSSRQACQFKRSAGYYAQSSLRAYYKLFEVVARYVFGQFPPQMYYVALRRD